MRTLLLFTISVIFGFNVFAQIGVIGYNATGSVNDTDIVASYTVYTLDDRIGVAIYKYTSPTSGTVVIPGTSNYFCWGGVCADTGATMSQYIDFKANDTVIAEIHYNPNGIAGTSYFEYDFTSVNPQSDWNNPLKVIVSITATTGGTTAINENTSSSILSEPYPNPASRVATISYHSLSNNNYMTIYDITGKEIMSKKVAKGQAIVLIDVSDFENGVYFYTLKNQEGTVATRRLVVAR